MSIQQENSIICELAGEVAAVSVHIQPDLPLLSSIADSIHLEDATLKVSVLGLDCALTIGEKGSPQDELPQSFREAAFRYQHDREAERTRRSQEKALVSAGGRAAEARARIPAERGRGGYGFLFARRSLQFVESIP